MERYSTDAAKRPIVGLYPVVPTPLLEGSVDASGCSTLVDALVPHVHGVTLLGSMGEGPSLAVPARQATLEAFSEASAGRLGIVVGIGANALEDSIALARHASACGVDALFLPAPNYYAASPDGLLDYFVRVAEVTELPIVLYDNPYITGFRLPPSFMAQLASRAPTFTYVKVTDRTHGKVEAIRSETPLIPLSGADDLMHHHVLCGARGVLTGVPCVLPRVSRCWWDLLEAGDATTAFQTFATQMAPMALEMMSEGDTYPVLTKECLRLKGVLSSASVLPPLQPLTPNRVEDMKRVLELTGEMIPVV